MATSFFHSTDASKTIHVLLIEDSESSVAMISDALANEPQIRLTVARSLVEAQAMLKNMIPDLVIADLMLPDGKGTELLSTGSEQAFPMIVLTGRGNEKEAVEAMKAGALDYLVKTEETLTDIPRIVVRSLRVWGHIIEHKRSAEALRQSEERFRSVFTTAAAGMIIISPTGLIQQANPAFCRFIGRSESELAKLSIEEVTHPDDRDMTSVHYGEIFTGTRQHLHYEKRYLRKDGQTIWGHASVACVMNPDMQPIYCIGLVQDITERKQIEEELRRANRELDAFVHTVSHDLRSPLTPIIGYADFLKEHYREKLDEQAMDSLAAIHRQGHRMLRLLEDLLALARTGRLEMPDEPVDCSQVMEEVISGLASQILSSGVVIQKEPLPALRVPRTLLVQLFDNLVGNALRYAGKAGGSIEVGGVRDSVRVTLYVRDHGAGIPSAEMDRIFDLFYRGSTGKDLEGTGVGLATVQKIAHLFGGRAWVEETPGGGCTFRVELVDAVQQHSGMPE